MCVTLDPFQVLFMQSNEACIVCLHPIADVMMTWGECLLAWGEGQIWREKCYGGTKNGKFNLGGPGLLGGPWIMMGVPPTLDETMLIWTKIWAKKGLKGTEREQKYHFLRFCSNMGM